MSPKIAQVALPIHLHKTFDYLLADELPIVGARVMVPFGRQSKIGFVVALSEHSELPIDKLKRIEQVLDKAPLLPEKLSQLLLWASGYYQHPLGSVLDTAIPSELRKGKSSEIKPEIFWRITEQGRAQRETTRATKQALVLNLLAKTEQSQAAIQAQNISTSVLKTVEKKGWIESFEKTIEIDWQASYQVTQDKPILNQEQAVAVAAIQNAQKFACYLLEGITGSGKTEVYLNALEPVLSQGKQALILVPEIGLTPQTIDRFKKRFNVPIAVVHSHMNDKERLNAWVLAKKNQAGILIGTRSALFSPLEKLGIIIVDEEHDLSYKQHRGFRYHARDLAVMLAHKFDIPIVLGSATPSLESVHNANTQKYHHLILSQRAGNAIQATCQIVDMRCSRLEAGLSAPLLREMKQHLDAGNQVMLFLNRRGFAPALMCHECGWVAGCQRCDAFYTYYQKKARLRCHHCQSERHVIKQCETCGSTQMNSVGVGTEQLESTLSRRFAEYNVLRFDRDSTTKKGAFERHLDDIHNNKYQILIGTQMLAKGHHFPNVTLVAIIDVDSALFSQDFRASERLAQLFIQVSGRAGRASKPGKVLLQTHHPDHPLIQALAHGGYTAFSQQTLIERKVTQLPPFKSLALFRAEAHNNEQVESFLLQVQHTLQETIQLHQKHHSGQPTCRILGPLPAPMERKEGRYRWQLIFQSPDRKTQQKILTYCLPFIQHSPLANKVRWSLDVEPQEMN